MPDGPEEIADTDELHRLIFPDHVRSDGSISSAAFMRSREPDPEISVNVARLTTIERTLAPKAGKGHYLGVLVAAHPRGIGLSVVHDPVPADNPWGWEENYAHALITGAYSKALCAQLAALVRLTGYRA